MAKIMTEKQWYKSKQHFETEMSYDLYLESKKAENQNKKLKKGHYDYYPSALPPFVITTWVPHHWVKK